MLTFFRKTIYLIIVTIPDFTGNRDDKAERMILTKQRRIILEELRKVTSHPSADQVYDMVRKRLPRISLGTVYRNLEFLSRQGLIQKLKGSTHKHYDGNPSCHCHFRCTVCDKVVDLSPALRMDEKDAASALPGFKLKGYQVDFFGICPDCQAKSLDFEK
jgi:Fur family transcriptional regulator, ferric uptake regulator